MGLASNHLGFCGKWPLEGKRSTDDLHRPRGGLVKSGYEQLEDANPALIIDNLSISISSSREWRRELNLSTRSPSGELGDAIRRHVSRAAIASEVLAASPA